MEKLKEWLIQKIPWYTEKIHSILMYLVMGVFTTIINIVAFWLLASFFEWDYRIANTIAWIVSVLFAYVTNKKYVFVSYTPTWRDKLAEVSSFFGFRFITFLIDMAFMVLFIDVFMLNETWAKIWVNIIVLVLNYVFSKWLIFKIRKPN
ncbi:wall teichoic acid glycosylation protein GtcA [Listeria fleischmannii 1991]|uniref:GtrA-like protein n=2 Tax=Listeria fleischmannii TaxID=1069827 RepID=A0A2X3HJ37_9LIST|nr:GtrA family protein [Listeria fleischmannii]EMG29009.1 wall teichoic acid glycosylation protein GtcA [Listeria fleischmannii subsp. fleischmannii LU2006-1]KMT60803.1 wall teichoic acid glycosylation protein GtcA [Listeria fleischmannii 1991]SQC70705.1 GtrA-like protein [Listeria fleischmannii subsp. fleischmannii]